MSLTDEFSTNNMPEGAEEYGERMVSKYGLEVCKAASVIDEQNVTDSTATSYKSQVRQVLRDCDDKCPTPRGVADYISDIDKKSSTKSLMVSAMECYYSAIDEPDLGDELRNICNNRGITDKDFNTETTISGWITKEEVNNIQEHLLPDEGDKIKKLDFADTTWVLSIEHKALAMTLYYTACRVGELCRRDSNDEALKVEDIYADDSQLKLYRLKKGGKGYKRDMRAVPQELIGILNEYLDMKNIEEGHVFPFTTRTAQNRIQEINEVYEHAFGDFQHMDKLTPHKFRHGRITDIANNSSLEEAGQYVDHASPETTNQYRHLATEEQREILPEENDSNDIGMEAIMDKLGVDDPEKALEIIDQMS